MTNLNDINVKATKLAQLRDSYHSDSGQAKIAYQNNIYEILQKMETCCKGHSSHYASYWSRCWTLAELFNMPTTLYYEFGTKNDSSQDNCTLKLEGLQLITSTKSVTETVNGILKNITGSGLHSKIGKKNTNILINLMGRFITGTEYKPLISRWGTGTRNTDLTATLQLLQRSVFYAGKREAIPLAIAAMFSIELVENGNKSPETLEETLVEQLFCQGILMLRPGRDRYKALGWQAGSTFACERVPNYDHVKGTTDLSKRHKEWASTAYEFAISRDAVTISDNLSITCSNDLSTGIIIQMNPDQSDIKLLGYHLRKYSLRTITQSIVSVSSSAFYAVQSEMDLVLENDGKVKWDVSVRATEQALLFLDNTSNNVLFWSLPRPFELNFPTSLKIKRRVS